MRVIGYSTNGLRGTAREGVGSLFRFLWTENQHPEITFVTFNQDVLIEKALQRASETRRYGDIPWNIASAYCVDFERLTGAKWDTQLFTEQAEDEQSIRVLKLHGSLNWVYEVRSGTDPKNVLRTADKRKLFCIKAEQLRVSLVWREHKRRMRLFPFVVPPIYEKSLLFKGSLGPVWRAAREALESADQIIVFGYSFPDADFAARTLLRRCYFSNEALREVTVIDPDPRVGAKVSELLSLDALHTYRNVSSFKGAQMQSE